MEPFDAIACARQVPGTGTGPCCRAAYMRRGGAKARTVVRDAPGWGAGRPLEHSSRFFPVTRARRARAPVSRPTALRSGDPRVPPNERAGARSTRRSGLRAYARRSVQAGAAGRPTIYTALFGGTRRQLKRRPNPVVVAESRPAADVARLRLHESPPPQANHPGPPRSVGGRRQSHGETRRNKAMGALARRLHAG